MNRRSLICVLTSALLLLAQLHIWGGERFGPGTQLELYTYLQIPVYQDVNESQLAPRFGFIMGLSKRF